MPQMSPLGWFWLVIYVSFIYYMVMILFYYIWSVSFSFEFGIEFFKIYGWMW